MRITTNKDDKQNISPNENKNDTIITTIHDK